MRLCLERYIRSCEPPSTGSLSSSDAKSTYSHLYYKLTCLIEEAWTYLLIRVKLGIIRGTRHRFGGVSWRCRGERPCSLASEPYPGRPAAPQTLLPEAAKGQAPTSSARYLPCQVPQYIIIIIRDISSGRVMDRASRPQSRMSSRWQSRPRCHVVGASSSMARSPTMTNSISLCVCRYRSRLREASSDADDAEGGTLHAPNSTPIDETLPWSPGHMAAFRNLPVLPRPASCAWQYHP